jgi:UPF0042 nucleotide-binding protein
MNFMIVSGLSGAGKSVALNTLEDIGYNCIDNLPLFLLSQLVLGLSRKKLYLNTDYTGVAVGIDARNQPKHLSEVPQILHELKEQDIQPQILFLEAQTETLIIRFNETRRKHPLTSPSRSLAEAIEYERELLEPLSKAANTHIDTTHTTIHELRDLIRSHQGTNKTFNISILLQSFGFKKGVPEDFDFVFDVRCLPNPHWQPHLRNLTGLDTSVIEFLEQSQQVLKMRDDIARFFEHWLPAFQCDGRSYLTIAIGCTGGKHRSVYMVAALRSYFISQGHQVLVRHRELKSAH